MPRSNPYQPAFSAGELSPRLWARTDFAKYSRGLELCENILPLAEGGAVRRPGSRYVSSVKDASVRSRLRRFEFSNTQAYMLEFGENVIRFFRHQGAITANDVGAQITNGTFDTDITSWDDVSEGSEAIQYNATEESLTLVWAGSETDASIAEQDITTSSTGTEHCLRFRVVGPQDGIVHVRVGSASGLQDYYEDTAHQTGWHSIVFTPSASPFYLQFRRQSDYLFDIDIDDVVITDGTTIEIGSPYSADDILTVEGPQSADVLYLFHEDHQTHKLLRFGHASWSLVEVLWQDGPFMTQPNTALARGKTSSAGNGGGTTVVDAERNEADDFWNGKYLFMAERDDSIFASAYAGEVRKITNFVSSSGTFTVSPAFSGQVAINSAYEIWTEDDFTAMWVFDTDSTTTLHASATADINDGQGFLTTDVGRLVRINARVAATDWTWGIITEFHNSQKVGINLKRPIGTNSSAELIQTTDWRLGSWSETTGYPRNGAFYEQRLFACGTALQPQTFWASNTGDFEVMSPDSPGATSSNWEGTVEDDDALDFTLSADDVSVILWMSPGEDTLVIGTSGGEWVPSSSGAVLTPTDITVRRQTSHGCAPIQPVRIDSVVLFVQKAKRKIREFGFAFEIDGYRAPDMTRLAQHITKSSDRKGIVELAYQEEPDSIVWAVRSDGQLLSMTYRREEDVVGWSRHIFGGSFSGGDAVVESVACIPGADGDGQTQSSEDRDEVWVIVKRTINGNMARYIEVLEGAFEHGDEQEDAYYADSCITYDGVAATTITGLDHLEGATVAVLADGAVHTTETVSSGQIVLDAAASVVQIGLPYTHKLKTLKVEGGTAAGTAVNKTKRIAGVGFVVLDSHTMSFGPDFDTLETIDFREVADEVDEAVPYFTGEVFKEFDDDWKTDPRICIQSSDPTPYTLLALAPRNSVNEVK